MEFFFFRVTIGFYFTQNEKRVKLLLEYEDENLAGIDGDDFHGGDSTEDSDDPVCK